jgi:hypothetical protein
VALLQPRPGARNVATPPAPPPSVHPIALLAHPAVDALASFTVAQLRRRARSAGRPRALSRNNRRVSACHRWDGPGGEELQPGTGLIS